MLLEPDTLDLVFRRAVIGVVFRVLPVDKSDGKALGIPFDRLGNAGSKAQQIIGLFILMGCTGGPKSFERLHRVLNGIFREWVRCAFELIAAVSTDVVNQNRL